ncbi:adenosylcobinamide amidohydrolase [Aneurinibacillus tyrosinisolvens]|uniref:adenosylcobinamide amidohydrolase n=1 Tax=Aneurinibacillus tyrosinisolvens TaxID=1443435 RepID=UPI00063FB17C|nr:adenosylcobinamide amidohydrolase [Aneurinibacillus tyrosinisolvens]
MTQPFRTGNMHPSLVWPDVSVHYKGDHLLFKTTEVLTVFSNALWQGGMATASHFVNWKVPLNYRSEDPADMMHSQVAAWGYPPDETVGLQTAAKITHASIAEDVGDKFRMICCATAGTRNGARAGRQRETFSAYRCGTINVFLLLDANMTPSAMVNGIVTATEAKTAALQDLNIREESGELATGTTTDAVVLAVSQRQEYGVPHQFAGAATTIGNAIGRLVYETVYEAVVTQGEA